MRLVSLYFFGCVALLALCVLVCPGRIQAQMVIGGASPDPSASLDLQSLKKGFLPPRMTSAQRDAIPLPAFGLVLINTTAQCVQINLGSPASPNWKCLSVEGSTLALHASDTLYWNRKLDAADTASLSARFDAKLSAFTEADPLFANSTAAAITPSDTAYWNRKLNTADTASLSARINAKLSAFTEADPLFAAATAAAITPSDTAYWNRKLNIADTASLSARFDAKLNAFIEADPLFAAATAAAITPSDTAYWNRKLNAADTASLSARIDSKIGLMQTGNVIGNLLYWSGTQWARIAPGQEGNVLTYTANGTPFVGMTIDTVSQALRLAIAAPKNSRLVYQTDADTGYFFYKKIAWNRLASYRNDSSSPLAFGFEAGQTSQGPLAIAIGTRSGNTGQGSTATAIGHYAGNQLQGQYAIAIGSEAGRDSQSVQAIAVGLLAGSRRQSQNAVAIGWSSGYLSQGPSATAIGMNSGQNYQGGNAIALGRWAGYQLQGVNATAIGTGAGRDSQSVNAIALGFQAGYGRQGFEAIAIGVSAGQYRQGDYTTALGKNAAYQEQEPYALAIGYGAAFYKQGQGAISLGTEAGRDTQGIYSVAIGQNAGFKKQGQYAIAIGANAGYTSQHNRSVILNASGTTLNSTYTNALYIAPIRNAASGTTTLHYDPASKEVFYSTNTSDLRLKRNVQPIPSGLAALLQLRPVTFDMKISLADTLYPIHKAGFIAQEVQQVLPGLVSPLPGPDTLLTLNTTDIIPLLVKAVQELHAENQVLKQETSALREKIAQGASLLDKKRRP